MNKHVNKVRKATGRAEAITEYDYAHDNTSSRLHWGNHWLGTVGSWGPQFWHRV